MDIMPRWQENKEGGRAPAIRLALDMCELRAGCRSVCKLGEFVEGEGNWALNSQENSLYIRNIARYFVYLQKIWHKMKSTSDYLRILKQFKETKAASYGIQKIGLFGSVARGEQQEGSDVDVCFEGNAIGLFKLSALKSELEELFGTTVDLLRMRKQLDGTILKDSVMKDLIYV